MTNKTSKPDWVDSYPTYEDMVDSWGYEVVECRLTGSYQGDYLVLLRDGERWGFTVIGYGSCSGCDALEAATPWLSEDQDWTAVVSLSEELRNDIRWYDDGAALVEYLDSQIAQGQWWFNDTEIRGVIEEFKIKVSD